MKKENMKLPETCGHISTFSPRTHSSLSLSLSLSLAYMQDGDGGKTDELVVDEVKMQVVTYPLN